MHLCLNTVNHTFTSTPMKHSFILSALTATFTIFTVLISSNAQALPSKKKKSLLDNDPEVIYLSQYSAKPIIFVAIEPANVYASKKGKASRKLGTFKIGSKLQLVAMNENAYRVSGKGKHGKLSGWVSPNVLANKDPEFVDNLKKLYLRQMVINQLIANKEVAIGMTIEEVTQSLGKPTKKETKINQNGRTGKWEFITYEEQKHYHYVTDPVSRQVYKRLSHVTTEEKSKLTVEFANDVVTSVASMEDNGPSKVRIINPPIIFGF